MIRQLLAHPLTRGLDIDDPQTTTRRCEIIKSKPFLHRIYEDWYDKLFSHLPDVPGAIVELGSGAGFLDKVVPNLITSEIFLCPNVSIVLNGCELPFADSTLRAIILVDVLHHIPNVRQFFSEARRCLVPGGRLLMIEPWVSSWSRFIYSHLHHEPFRPNALDWTFPDMGPLSGANGALPWIVFSRDRRHFETEFPDLAIRTMEPWMPFRYLVSGGVSMRTLMPACTYWLWKAIEESLQPWNNTWAMFAFITIEHS